MDFIELAKNRYSCKNFSDRVVDRDSLRAILEAGRLAPTAQNRQGQHIYVVESKKAFQRLINLHHVDTMLKQLCSLPLIRIMPIHILEISIVQE